jgi:hypothetical protein
MSDFSVFSSVCCLLAHGGGSIRLLLLHRAEGGCISPVGWSVVLSIVLPQFAQQVGYRLNQACACVSQSCQLVG